MIFDQVLFGDVTVWDLVFFVLVIASTVIVGHLVYALVRRTLQERISKPSAKGVARLLEYMIIALGLYLAFSHTLSFDITGALVSLGIVGIALAFASQQIVQNAFAGIMFSITRPLQLEDWVEVGGLPATGLCRVKDITLIHTVMRDLDGRILYVPNSFILNNKLLNYAKAGFVTVSFQLRLSSLEDIEKVKRIISQEADHNPCVLPHVKGEERRAISKVLEKASFRSLYHGGPLDMSMFEPQVSITDLQRTRTVVTVKVWIREVNRRDRILSDLLEGIGKRLREEGIEVADS